MTSVRENKVTSAKAPKAPKAPKVETPVKAPAESAATVAQDEKALSLGGAQVGSNASAAAGASADGAAQVGTADATGNKLQRMLGTASSTSVEGVMKDVKSSIVWGLPMQALFDAQSYRTGKVTAKQYVGNVASESLGYGAWTIGGALATAGLTALFPALAPAGLLLGVAGFAAGMLGYDLWGRTIGKPIANGIAKLVPNAIAKPIANVVAPIGGFLHDHVWQPFVSHIGKPVLGFVMQHKLIAAAAAGLVALRFPGLAKGIGVMAGGTAVGMGLEHFTLDKVLPQQPGASAPQTGSAFDSSVNDQITLDAQTKALIHQRYATAFDWNGNLPAQEVSDAEKLYYVKALSEVQTDPTKIQELDQLFGAMQQQFNARWPQQPAVPGAQPPALLGQPPASIATMPINVGG